MAPAGARLPAASTATRASGFCPKALLVERSASVKPPMSEPDGADGRVLSEHGRHDRPGVGRAHDRRHDGETDVAGHPLHLIRIEDDVGASREHLNLGRQSRTQVLRVPVDLEGQVALRDVGDHQEERAPGRRVVEEQQLVAARSGRRDQRLRARRAAGQTRRRPEPDAATTARSWIIGSSVTGASGVAVVG